jgi:hypothetical protein
MVRIFSGRAGLGLFATTSVRGKTLSAFRKPQFRPAARAKGVSHSGETGRTLQSHLQSPSHFGFQAAICWPTRAQCPPRTYFCVYTASPHLPSPVEGRRATVDSDHINLLKERAGHVKAIPRLHQHLHESYPSWQIGAQQAPLQPSSQRVGDDAPSGLQLLAAFCKFYVTGAFLGHSGHTLRSRARSRGRFVYRQAKHPARRKPVRNLWAKGFRFCPEHWQQPNSHHGPPVRHPPDPTHHTPTHPLLISPPPALAACGPATPVCSGQSAQGHCTLCSSGWRPPRKRACNIQQLDLLPGC